MKKLSKKNANKSDVEESIEKISAGFGLLTNSAAAVITRLIEKHVEVGKVSPTRQTISRDKLLEAKSSTIGELDEED